MAFFTAMLGVRTQQRIARFLLMVKGLGRLPLFGRVAEAAFIPPEFAFVKVHILFHVALIARVHKTRIPSFTIPRQLA